MPAAPTPAKPNGEGITLADILLNLGALSAERAKEVKLAEIQTGTSQEDIIKKQNLVSEEFLTQAKAKLYNIPYIDLSNIPSAPEAIAAIDQEISERFKIFPVSVDKQAKQLTLAMADPLDLTAIEFIEQKTGLHIKPEAASPSQITDAIATRYSASLSKEVTAAVKGGPITSDAVRADAQAVGLDELVPIILTGPDTLGLPLDEMSSQVRAALHTADWVISKGQANYYACSQLAPQLRADIFCLLRTKCTVAATSLGLKPARANVAVLLPH